MPTINNIEELNKEQKNIILDTSSINQILKDKNLLIKFFDKVQNINSIVAIPPIALAEISSDLKTFDDFKNIYREKNCLRIIRERPAEIMKREIDSDIGSYLYWTKNNDIFSNIDREIIEEQKKNDQKKKKGWKENCQQIKERMCKEFSVKPEERNKGIKEILKNSNFLVNYMKEDNWVLDFFKKYLNIDFPKEKIYSNRNRYKYINLSQCLMLINMYKSVISGNSDFSAKWGDLFDGEIASYSAHSYCFISEDKGLVQCLQIIKNGSKQIGLENKYKIYHKIENFCQDTF